MPTYLKERKANPWRAQARRKGFKTEVAYFPTKDEAEEWEEVRRGALRRKAKGLPADIAVLGKINIGSMIDRYLKEESAYKAGGRDEAYRIEIFRNWNNVATRPLIAFQRTDAIEFRNYLEKEYIWKGKPYMRNRKLVTPNYKPKRIKAGTVKRIMDIMRDMWNIAANDWKGYEALKEMANPWHAVSPKGRIRKRTRRLNDLPHRKMELERILKACDESIKRNRLYLRLAVNMAVQTGMRRQEILLLRWNDIDEKAKTINIRKSKTDYKSDVEGRTIVLPFRCLLYLAETWALTYGPDKNIFKKNELIFPFDGMAFSNSWVRVIRRAGIASKEQDAASGIKESQCGLEFKDLRREAGSRFDEAGLTKAEHDLMLGHESKEIRGIYIAPYLKRIAEKLNSYWGENLEYMDSDYLYAVANKLSIQDILLNMVFKEKLGGTKNLARAAESLDGEVAGGYRFENAGGMIKLTSVTGEEVKELPANVVELFKQKAKAV